MLLSKADAMKAVNKKRGEKLELIEPVKTPNGSGGYATVMTSRGFVWAEFRKPNIKTEVVAGAISSVLLREIGIRYRADVKKGWQVMCGLKTYSVEHTYDYGKETTILVAKEIIK